MAFAEKWDDDDVFDQISTSTIAVILLFGSITFCTTAMAARTWLLGDNSALGNAISFASTQVQRLQSNNNNMNVHVNTLEVPALQTSSFLSVFVLLYHVTLFGLILSVAYILEHHPPFTHLERSGGFDEDYLIFLVALVMLYSYSTIRHNDGGPRLGQHHLSDNRASLSVHSGRSESSYNEDGGIQRSDHSRTSLADILLEDDDTIRTPSITASTIVTQQTGHTLQTKTSGTRTGYSKATKQSQFTKGNDNESFGSQSTSGSRLQTVNLEEDVPFLKKPQHPQQRSSRRKERLEQHQILNIHQSLEWKGFLIACFLLYKISAADVSLEEFNLFYNASKVGGSSFCFLTGFGHAMYFYKTNQYKFARVVRVLVRINLTAFWLCLTLGRPYIFYAACPLHSCMFLLTFGIMQLHRSYNYTKYGLRIKLCAMAGVIFLLWDLNGGLFSFLNLPFFSTGPPSVRVPGGPLWEWYYQSYMHHWAGFIGIVYAINYPITNLLLYKIENLEGSSSLLAKGIMGVVLGGAFGLWLTGPFWTQKYAFDLTHPYFGFLPILSYVYFRNVSQTFRERYIYLFQNLGSLTLELYVLHHHFFLSSDGTTVLVLLPGYPKCNLILLGVLLFYMALFMKRITNIFCDMLLNETMCIHTMAAIGVLTTSFYAVALALHLAGMVNMITIAAIVIACGFVLYHTIMEMTWQEYCNANIALDKHKAESSVSKLSSPLIGAMFIFLLGTSWHLQALVGATGTEQSLPMQCDAVVNDGMWVPVSACTEYQRGKDYRDLGSGSYYRECDNIRNLQWGWRTTAPASHCRFHPRDALTLQKKLKQRTIVFIGDSTVHKMFHAVCRAAGDDRASLYDSTVSEHSDVGKTIGDVRLEYRTAPLASDQMAKLKDIRTRAKSVAGSGTPDLLVLGGGMLEKLHIWATDENQDSHKKKITQLAKELAMTREKLDIPIIWCTPTTINTPALSNDEKRTQMNEMAIVEMRKLYADLGVETAASFVMDGPSYTRDRVTESFDGVHYPLTVYDVGAQIMANAMDWLLLDEENTFHEEFVAPTPGTMGNPLLGLMMICICLFGLMFFDGYFGCSYLAAMLIRSNRHRITVVMPNDLYGEAFDLYHQYLKLPALESTTDRGTGSSIKNKHSKRNRWHKSHSNSTIEDSDILSLLTKSTTSQNDNLMRRSRSGDRIKDESASATSIAAVSFRLD